MNRLLLQVLYFFARTDGQLARSTEGSQYTPPQKEELAQLQLDGLLPRLLGPDEVLQAAPQGQQQGPIQYIANVVHPRAKLEIRLNNCQYKDIYLPTK